MLGTVPVEADGSAHFSVPADTAIYFQALDQRQMEVLRMRSFVSFKAGEVRGCPGCHESRAESPALTPQVALALQKPPCVPAPPRWGADRLLGFEWLVQPVLDRHCVRCHGAQQPAGRIDLAPPGRPTGCCSRTGRCSVSGRARPRRPGGCWYPAPTVSTMPT